MRRIAPLSSLTRSVPRYSIDPPTILAPGGSRRRMDCTVVVLPLPDSPTSPSVCPSSSVKLTSSTAFTRRLPPSARKCVSRCETRSRGAVMSEVPQMRVELHPQPVADHVRRQDQQHDADAGPGNQPPLALHQGVTLL